MQSDTVNRRRFGITFSLLARRWRRMLDAHLASVGLTDATWVPLVHLHETGGGLTQKGLAVLVGVDGSSLVRVLDILERDGLIERRPDKNDGRAKLIYLTDAGKPRVEEILGELYTAEVQMLNGIDDSSISELIAQLDTIERNITAKEASTEEVER